MTSRGTYHQWAARGTSRRRALGVLSAGSAAFGLAIAGCGSDDDQGTGASGTASQGGSPAAGATTGTPKQGGSLATYLNSPSSEQLEPQGLRSNSANTQPLFALIYDTLLRYKVGADVAPEDRTIEGSLAAKWEQPDPTTLTFQLRPGVKFHNKPPVNGRDLVAEDVKFSFDRLINSRFAYLNFYEDISTIETPSPQTVTFKLKQPSAPLLTHLSVGFAWIIAKEAGKADDKGSLGLSYLNVSSAIGTGPFMADSYEHGVRFSTTRSPSYFEQGKPYLDKAEYQVIQDESTILAALGAGQLQVGAVPAGSVEDLRASTSRLTYHDDMVAAVYYTTMRVDKPPFDDIRVRRAMAMAFDQKDIAAVWGTPDTPFSYGSVSAVVGNQYLPADKLGENAKWWQVNLQEAKQLLTAAGYGDGFTAPYNGSVATASTTDLPELISAQMAKIGINVPLEIKEHSVYQTTTLLGDYDGLGYGFIPLYDADDMFSTFLPDSRRNMSHVSDPRLDELRHKERTELDSKKRLEIIHEADRYLAGQVYYLVKPQYISTVAAQPNVKNYQPRPGYQPVFTVTWLE